MQYTVYWQQIVSTERVSMFEALVFFLRQTNNTLRAHQKLIFLVNNASQWFNLLWCKYFSVFISYLVTKYCKYFTIRWTCFHKIKNISGFLHSSGSRFFAAIACLLLMEWMNLICTAISYHPYQTLVFIPVKATMHSQLHLHSFFIKPFFFKLKKQFTVDKITSLMLFLQ